MPEPTIVQPTIVRSDVDAIAELAVTASVPDVLTPGEVYRFTDDERGSYIVDTEPYAQTPRRKRGTITVRDTDSLIGVVDKHGIAGQTEVYADPDGLTITAILNAGSDDEPGWGDHRAVLKLAKTPAWLAWTNASGRLMGQTDFAEFIEQRVVDILDPTGADILEMAQTFKATKAVNFESSRRLSTGAIQLTYKEDIEARAGRRGDLSIPETLTLALAPFDGSDPYRMFARFRYRITDGTLQLGFVLERPQDILTAAFDGQRTLVEEGTGCNVWLGTGPGH